MRNRFVRLLLLFAALWLPVQTMAGMAMTLCSHSQEAVAVAPVAQDTAADAMPCHEAAAQDQAVTDAGCDHCQTCQLASAGFMPSAVLAAGLIPARYHYMLPAIVAPSSHVGEPPQHPPRNGA